MDFLTGPVWWILLVAASICFAAYCKLGRKSLGSPIGTISRIGFLGAVAGGFVINGWLAGMVMIIPAGLLGLLLLFSVERIMVGQVPATPRRPIQRADASGSPGRGTILLDMMTHGITREKVRGLIRQGTLIAYEDPRDHRISLMRPEDMEAIRESQHESEEDGSS